MFRIVSLIKLYSRDYKPVYFPLVNRFVSLMIQCLYATAFVSLRMGSLDGGLAINNLKMQCKYD